jgi:alpha-L-fucosidase
MKTINKLITEYSNFSLKNFDKVKANNPLSKNKEVQKVIAEYREIFPDTSYLSDTILSFLTSGNAYYHYQKSQKDFNEAKVTGRKVRTVFKEIHTWINQKTWELNARRFLDLPVSDSTRLKYATQLYLRHYNFINRAMKIAYKDLLNNYF